jgi:hypothetical protein
VSGEVFRLLCAVAAVNPDSQAISRSIAQLPAPHIAPIASAHGLLPQLAHELARCEAPSEVRSDVMTAMKEVTARNLGIIAAWDHTTELLSIAGIQHVPFKGPVLSDILYGDRFRRQSGDLDLLVRPSDALSARRCLEAAGYRFWADLRPDEEKRFLRIGNEYGLVAPSGAIVELSWAFAPAAASIRVPMAPMLGRSRFRTFEGRQVQTLIPQDLLLALSVHGAKHAWGRLGWVADIARLIHVTPELDVVAVVGRSRSLGVARMVLSGLALSANLLGLPLEREVRAELDRDPAVAPLVRALAGRLAAIGPEGAPEALVDPFALRLRERRRDRLLAMAKLALTPTYEDWQLVPDPLPSGIVAPLVRPFRLARKYLIRRR